ncbi:MAG: hypothetical protein FWB78_12275 [Treponema sp.]|nr:hypothetical protein [Treponema sp.]
MKTKIVFVGLMLTTVAITTLHAQITIGLSADMAAIPFQLIQGVEVEYPDGTVVRYDPIMGAGLGQIDGTAGPRIRLDMRAVNEDRGLGLRLRLQAQGHTSIGVENFLQAWWSPLEWLRFDIGRFDDDRLRGRIGHDDMHSFTVLMYDHDAIFNRIRARGGLMLSLSPIEGLLFTALLNGLNPLSLEGHNYDHPVGSGPGYRPQHHRPYFPTLSFVPWENRFGNGDMWRNMHVAMGYTIPGIGLVRVQYIGVIPGSPAVDPDADELDILPGAIIAPRIEAAFAFTGVEGLVLDLGGKVPLPISESFPGITETWQAPFRVSLGVQYRIGNLEIFGRVDTGFGGERSVSGANDEALGSLSFAPVVNVHLWPSFDFDAFRLILNAGFEFVGDTTRTATAPGGTSVTTVVGEGGTRFGMGLSLQRSFLGSFRVRGGVAYRFPTEVNGIQERGVFTIPLFLEYSF